MLIQIRHEETQAEGGNTRTYTLSSPHVQSTEIAKESLKLPTDLGLELFELANKRLRESKEKVCSMPVIAKLINGRWRIVEAANGKIAQNRAGTPIDGGGHESKQKAQAQAGAINSSLHPKGR